MFNKSILSLLIISTHSCLSRNLSVINNDNRVTNKNPYIKKAIGAIGEGEYVNGEWRILFTFCTGTLYNRRYIFTSAHCVQDVDNKDTLGNINSKNIIFVPNYPDNKDIYMPKTQKRSRRKKKQTKKKVSKIKKIVYFYPTKI